VLAGLIAWPVAQADDVIAIICRHLATISSSPSSVPIFSFGGAMARVPEEPRRSA
jgi:hypothetical protein